VFFRRVRFGCRAKVRKINGVKRREGDISQLGSLFFASGIDACGDTGILCAFEVLEHAFGSAQLSSVQLVY